MSWTGGILFAAGVIVVGIPFMLIWWKFADAWADSEHKRFKGQTQKGPEPQVVKRSTVETTGDEGPKKSDNT